MKRLFLSLVVVVGGFAAGPASAQYYGGGGYGGYDRPRPPPDEDFDRPRRYDYDRPRPYGYGPPRGYDGPDRRFSATCVTARGACPTGRPLPHGAPCGCEIPGFGYKRGATN